MDRCLAGAAVTKPGRMILLSKETGVQGIECGLTLEPHSINRGMSLSQGVKKGKTNRNRRRKSMP